MRAVQPTSLTSSCAIFISSLVVAREGDSKGEGERERNRTTTVCDHFLTQDLRPVIVAIPSNAGLHCAFRGEALVLVLPVPGTELYGSKYIR